MVGGVAAFHIVLRHVCRSEGSVGHFGKTTAALGQVGPSRRQTRWPFDHSQSPQSGNFLSGNVAAAAGETKFAARLLCSAWLEGRRQVGRQTGFVAGLAGSSRKRTQKQRRAGGTTSLALHQQLQRVRSGRRGR